NFLGTIGTAALLLVVAISYMIWQFNPSFNLPVRKAEPRLAEPLEEEPVLEAEEEELPLTPVAKKGKGKSINDIYASEEQPALEKANLLKGEGPMVLNLQEEEDHGFGLT